MLINNHSIKNIIINRNKSFEMKRSTLPRGHVTKDLDFVVEGQGRLLWGSPI